MDATGGQTPSPESRPALEERYRAALAEVERLATPDDHGTGERTARFAGLASWQAEVERLRGLLDEFEAVTPEGGPRAG